MDDLRELYQEVILDHNKKPRNHRKIADAERTAEGFNPLCGDRLTVYLSVEDDQVADVSFVGSGCAISTASASLMTESVKGRPLAEVERLFECFHALVTTKPGSEPQTQGLGKLVVFGGVCEFPMRVKCATLAWHTLRAALHGTSNLVKTE